MRVRSEIIKFAVVGGANTVMDLAVFVALIGFGVPPLMAHAASYGAGTIQSFFLNRSWTFGGSSAGHSPWRQFGRFATVNLVSFLLGSMILWAGLGMGLPPLAAKLASILGGFFCNYGLNRAFVFRVPLSPRSA
ncbi:GtrA family protein [Arenibaculum pallidiluteum]|uniref:GtrA family protein n=1 Tax=Arenibaculum pallidiluteum TaxID=2812559 RepID=UPI001A97184B|nr:GtrA family protein [Arenibaculum pallidiluteum]